MLIDCKYMINNWIILIKIMKLFWHRRRKKHANKGVSNKSCYFDIESKMSQNDRKRITS